MTLAEIRSMFCQDYENLTFFIKYVLVYSIRRFE